MIYISQLSVGFPFQLLQIYIMIALLQLSLIVGLPFSLTLGFLTSFYFT